MAEVNLVEEHPNGCVACQAVSGPFVVVSLAGWTVNTVEGPFQVDTDIVLCAKRDGREGCAGQIARAAGYVGDDEHGNAIRQYEQALERNSELETRVGELEQQQQASAEDLAQRVAKAIIAEAG